MERPAQIIPPCYTLGSPMWVTDMTESFSPSETQVCTYTHAHTVKRASLVQLHALNLTGCRSKIWKALTFNLCILEAAPLQSDRSESPSLGRFAPDAGLHSAAAVKSSPLFVLFTPFASLSKHNCSPPHFYRSATKNPSGTKCEEREAEGSLPATQKSASQSISVCTQPLGQ